ncbi:MAG: endonuclease [Bacilli bacterium]|nr:endonuclease [Bacilli bacterium]
MKKHKALKIVLISLCSVFVLLIAFIGGALIFASATTLQVKDKEDMQIDSEVSAKVNKANEVKLLTWNIGYGALDEREDCYWDGGVGVDGESKETVLENMSALKSKIKELNPDIFFVQEADRDSKRSYYVNEYDSLRETFTDYNGSFAPNFKAGIVPLPLYNMTGKVDAGIASFSKYTLSDSTRIQLPIPFSWPMSLFNLKRCLLVNHLPIEGSDKELVVINLHLEAYDDGEGKAKQLAMLMDLMKEEYEKGNYVLAGGDFNQTFSTTNYQKYPKVTDWECPVIDASTYPDFTFKMDDTHPTCRSLDKPYDNSDKSTHQYWMLDGFIVSNNITINSLETLDLGFKNTDHNPVKMSISLN